MQNRQVPYAVVNYREIVGGEYFFVDHTRFLRELQRYKTPDEIVSFVKRLSAEVSADKPIVVVPSTYAQLTEDELARIGVNVVIYANQLLRAAYPAMKACAERILECGRALEASAELCMPIKEIITLI